MVRFDSTENAMALGLHQAHCEHPRRSRSGRHANTVSTQRSRQYELVAQRRQYEDLTRITKQTMSPSERPPHQRGRRNRRKLVRPRRATDAESRTVTETKQLPVTE